MQIFLDNCLHYKLHIHKNVPLAPRCGFNTGGNAELFAEPQSKESLQLLLQLAYTHNITVTILGGGSNVLVPDDALLGLTISTCNLTDFYIKNNTAHIASGLTVRSAALQLVSKGKRALDFLYGMPGTVGGALWMNARCYNKEISEVLISASGFSIDGTPWNYIYNKDDFSYKKSPFQKHIIKNISSTTNTIKQHTPSPCIITECKIKLIDDNPIHIWNNMLDHEINRHSKGHYLAPCAGSIFKNNYNFNSPSGTLLDQLGWRNKIYNQAQVNPYHANIIINAGNACSKDIYSLSLQMQQSVYKTHAIMLEHELILLGEKSQWKK